MKALPVILIFDIGKTNKKILLFDEQYRLVYEESVQFQEAVDEDGYACEDINQLTDWVRSSFLKMLALKDYKVNAVNFSAYGASFVYCDENLKPILPLYNYLKPYPSELQDSFYKMYGGKTEFSKRTASPVLGSLNSGMQLYRLKIEKPEVFESIKYALHLPQYLSSIITNRAYSEITSIGCHTSLWDFNSKDYHEWVFEHGIQTKLSPILRSDACIQVRDDNGSFSVGVGLHDSSAALIPYLANFQEPFILLLTGTWCISLNPFNYTSLTKHELEKDCLCYLTYQGSPVKASRLFAGFEHELKARRILDDYKLPVENFKKLGYDSTATKKLRQANLESLISEGRSKKSTFANRSLSNFDDSEAAYHELIIEIVTRQLMSTKLVQRESNVKRIFVNGGFSKNSIYMHLMAAVFPHVKVYAASVAHASALGAALAIHKHWNKKPVPSDLIGLKFYSDATNDMEAS